MLTNLQAGPLSLAVYTPGPEGIFQVASTLVAGRYEAILIDAQFAARDARELVKLILESGRELTAVYISHGDPDFYFGLDKLRQYFPETRLMATQPTIDHIWGTRDSKLKVWGPRLGANAPKRIVMPELVPCDSLELEGHTLEIVGLDGPTPERSFLWTPAARTVLGGIPVVSGEHVWMADTQTPESRRHWLEDLGRIRALRPETVVPGHCRAGSTTDLRMELRMDLRAVDFTEAYIRAYDEETAKAENSPALVSAMSKRFPGLGAEANLELSARVSFGEMKWA